MKITAALLAFLILAPALASGERVAVGRFSSGDLDGWEEQVFKGRTRYELVPGSEGKTVLRALSEGTASGLTKKIEIDPRRRPRLAWSWKTSRPLPPADVHRKSGDDSAARVYVVFPGRFLWNTLSLCYIWASALPRGEFIPSAYAGRNVYVVAVESGEERAGEWAAEERDVAADFERCFGREMPPVGAVGIMTDTDDAGGRAEAWYGDIEFILEGPAAAGEKP